jgi:hypothetical protein
MLRDVAASNGSHLDFSPFSGSWIMQGTSPLRNRQESFRRTHRKSPARPKQSSEKAASTTISESRISATIRRQALEVYSSHGIEEPEVQTALLIEAIEAAEQFLGTNFGIFDTHINNPTSWDVVVKIHLEFSAKKHTTTSMRGLSWEELPKHENVQHRQGTPPPKPSVNFTEHSKITEKNAQNETAHTGAPNHYSRVSANMRQRAREVLSSSGIADPEDHRTILHEVTEIFGSRCERRGYTDVHRKYPVYWEEKVVEYIYRVAKDYRKNPDSSSPARRQELLWGLTPIDERVPIWELVNPKIVARPAILQAQQYEALPQAKSAPAYAEHKTKHEEKTHLFKSAQSRDESWTLTKTEHLRQTHQAHAVSKTVTEDERSRPAAQTLQKSAKVAEKKQLGVNPNTLSQKMRILTLWK